MEIEPIEETYFNWLCSKVMVMNGPPTPSTSYLRLLRVLHSTLFDYMIANDDNRAEDGLELRSLFLHETGYQEDTYWAASGCSVLEMLIAFANRAEFQTYSTSAEWFWVFIENLNLSQFPDAYLGPLEMEVSEILERFVYRKYSYSGRGGMFPLIHPQHDQRETELWHQFHEYLDEQE